MDTSPQSIEPVSLRLSHGLLSSNIVLMFKMILENMSYDVHLNIVGGDTAAVFSSLRTDRPMDRIYLLCDESHQDVLEDIVSGLSAVGMYDVIDIPLMPDDYEDTFRNVTGVLRSERSEHEDAVFHINFSSGDSVSAVALRDACESFGCDMFFMRDGRAVRMGSDAVDDLAALKTQSKILDTFLMFRDSDTRSNSELRGDLSAPALSYRTKELERLGLIASEGSYRNLMWSITPKGKQVLRRL